MEIMTTVTGAWNAFATKITAFLPMLIGAIVIFVVGWIFARLVRMAAVRLLKLVRFDSASEKTGITNFLRKGEIVKTPSEILGSLVYWFIMILVIIASLDALGLPIVSDILNDIFLYIPNVVAAIMVLILGILFGNLLSAVIRTAASNAGLSGADALGKAAFYAIIFFSSAIALIQLGVGEEIVTSAFGIVFGAAALALALAFGLGGRDVAGSYLKKWLEKKGSAQE
ncbi:MAG: hypothetical protein PVG99_01035 [Desulfobacteraceae bacterium]|jgi:hypothetical protein